MPIRSYLDDQSAFDPEQLAAMSRVRERLQSSKHRRSNRRSGSDRTRIIDLARNGAIDAKALSDRVIAEAKAMRTL